MYLTNKAVLLVFMQCICCHQVNVGKTKYDVHVFPTRSLWSQSSNLAFVMKLCCDRSVCDLLNA